LRSKEKEEVLMSLAASAQRVSGRSHASMLRMRPAQVLRQLRALDPECRWQTCAAATAVVDGLDGFIAKGGVPLAAVVDDARATQWQQYGSSDTEAETGGLHYFYHSHPAPSMPPGEHGHFHLFARVPGAAVEADRLAHLVAIGVDARGMPGRLFTTNRWVTGGNWFSASETIALAEKASTGHERLIDPVERWLCAQLGVFMPQVAALLVHRDRRIEASARGSRTLEDRRTYLLSQCRVSLVEQIATVEQANQSQP
jgi:hypothetical protein